MSWSISDPKSLLKDNQLLLDEWLLAKATDPEIQQGDFAAALGITYKAFDSKIFRAKRERRRYNDDPNAGLVEIQTAPIFHDKKIPEGIPWRELVKQAQTVQQLESQVDDTQRTAKVTIETQTPIGLMFTGDWQLGDMAVDYKQWIGDMEYVLDAPGLYMAVLGDQIQNMRSFKTLSAVLGQALSPKMQGVMLRGVIDEMTERKKILALLGGNHDDEFDERLFGERVTRHLLDNMDAPIFKNRGLLELTVGKETYTLLLFHKSRFRSFLRATHGNYREYELSFPADIVAGAHDHQPAYELISHYTLAREQGYPFGGYSYLVKVGSYQQNDDYAWKYFHNGQIAIFTVVLWPDCHKMQIFNSPQDAMEFVQAVT